MRPRTLVALLLAGCVTPGSYDTAIAHASCERTEECNQLVNTDVDGCVDLVERTAACLEEHCDDFDGENATACVARMRTRECDESGDPTVGDDCANVWSDCDEIAVVTCGLAAILE